MGTGQDDFQNPSSSPVHDFTTCSRGHLLAVYIQSPLYQLLWVPETSWGKLTGTNKPEARIKIESGPKDGLANTIQLAKTTKAKSMISLRTNNKKQGIIFLVQVHS